MLNGYAVILIIIVITYCLFVLLFNCTIQISGFYRSQGRPYIQWIRVLLKMEVYVYHHFDALFTLLQMFAGAPNTQRNRIVSYSNVPCVTDIR